MPSQVCFVRPHRSGKFLYAGNEKFWVRGVTYGTFRPSEDGCEYQRHALRVLVGLPWEQHIPYLDVVCFNIFLESKAPLEAFWTDEWCPGGHDIGDWDFGLTTRGRHPKPALESVRNAFAEVPFPPGVVWPRISVVICKHNGSRTIRECCEGLRELEYPEFEVVAVDNRVKLAFGVQPGSPI